MTMLSSVHSIQEHQKSSIKTSTWKNIHSICLCKLTICTKGLEEYSPNNTLRVPILLHQNILLFSYSCKWSRAENSFLQHKHS